MHALLLQRYRGPWSDVGDQEPPTTPSEVVTLRLNMVFRDCPSTQVFLAACASNCASVTSLVVGFHLGQGTTRMFEI